jgi:hypothetical protein
MKLRALGRYSNHNLGISVVAGMTFEVDDKLAAALLADSPESFEVVTEGAEPTTKVAKRVAKV